MVESGQSGGYCKQSLFTYRANPKGSNTPNQLRESSNVLREHRRGDESKVTSVV